MADATSATCGCSTNINSRKPGFHCPSFSVSGDFYRLGIKNVSYSILPSRSESSRVHIERRGIECGGGHEKPTLWGREMSRVSEKQLPRWDIEDALDEDHLSQVPFGR